MVFIDAYFPKLRSSFLKPITKNGVVFEKFIVIKVRNISCSDLFMVVINFVRETMGN